MWRDPRYQQPQNSLGRFCKPGDAPTLRRFPIRFTHDQIAMLIKKSVLERRSVSEIVRSQVEKLFSEEANFD